MELRNVRYFIQLANQQHMSRTADILNLSQPALSKAIRTLEDELQVKLFDRVGSRIKLNEAGQRFYESAQKSLAYLDSGIMTARNSKYDTNGTITIQNWAFAPIIGEYVGEYLKLNPLVNFHICRDPMHYGEEPCFLFRAISPEIATERTMVQHEVSWIVQPLLTSGNVLIMKAGYMDIPEDVTEVDMSMFRDARFILHYDESIIFQEITYSYCSEAGYYPHIYCKVEEFTSKMSLIEAGVGVAFIPEFCLPQARRLCPQLRAFTVRNDTRKCTIGILRKKNSLMWEAEQDFWDFVLDYFNVPDPAIRV